MHGGYVAITDNADPMNVVVYRAATKLGEGQKRVVCEVPVFDKGASATENSLISVGRSLFVENNYGYGPVRPERRRRHRAGLARVDVAQDGTGCKVLDEQRARADASSPKLRRPPADLHVHVRPDRAGVGARGTGRRSTSAPARPRGSARRHRPGFNNHYAGIALGPDGTAYLGTFGGGAPMTNLAHNLADSARPHGARTAIKLGDTELTMASSTPRPRAPRLLRSLGVQPGDRVGLMLPNVPQFAVAYYGILRAGAVVVPMNVLLKEREVGLLPGRLAGQGGVRLARLRRGGAGPAPTRRAPSACSSSRATSSSCSRAAPGPRGRRARARTTPR